MTYSQIIVMVCSILQILGFFAIVYEFKCPVRFKSSLWTFIAITGLAVAFKLLFVGPEEIRALMFLNRAAAVAGLILFFGYWYKVCFTRPI